MKNNLLLAINELDLDINKVTENIDGTIDYHGDVDISGMRLDKIPLKFNNVFGNFDCSDNELTTLKGCPKFVDGDFYCYMNKLSELRYGPKDVCGNYICSGNILTSLHGSPREIHGDFVCSNNLLKSLKNSPDIIRGNFIVTCNQIVSTIYFPKIIERNFVHDIPVGNKYIDTFVFIGHGNYNGSTHDYTVTEDDLELLGDFDPESIFIETDDGDYDE